MSVDIVIQTLTRPHRHTVHLFTHADLVQKHVELRYAPIDIIIVKTSILIPLEGVYTVNLLRVTLQLLFDIVVSHDGGGQSIFFVLLLHLHLLLHIHHRHTLKFLQRLTSIFVPNY